MISFKKLTEKYPHYEPIDLWFGQKITELDAREETVILITAAFISRLSRQGDVCLNLNAYTGKTDILYKEDDACASSFVFPEIKKWLQILNTRPCVGEPEEYKPLILNKNRVYMYKFWVWEKKIAKYIKSKSGEPFEQCDINAAKQIFNRIFDIDNPKTYPIILAGVSALLKKLTVIIGGPGTGKTTAAANILAMLINIETAKNSDKNMKIAFAAPTGKAAARLKEAMAKVKTDINYDKKILSLIPETSYTIHRLLKPTFDFSAYRHNKTNPLDFDIIVIDEASMIDIKLMTALIEAIDKDTKVIILGDKNQLASVEPGAVLADICGDNKAESFSKNFISLVQQITGINQNSLKNLQIKDNSFDNIIEFKTDFRFDKESGIKKLSDLINDQKAKEAFDYLKKGSKKDIKFITVKKPADLHYELQKAVLTYYKDYLTSENLEDCIRLFNQFKILCAVKKGYYGINTLNMAIEKMLEAKKLISLKTKWYHKKPLLITKNDYQTNLFNGDTAIVFNTDQNIPYAVLSDSNGKIRQIACSMLAHYQTAYAITVHKSQGSEFDNVILVLPDAKYPVLTKELIYTAVTRAKKKVTILGTEEIFLYCVQRKAERASGLKEELE